MNLNFKNKLSRGFTLIEIMVSVSIFAIVMTISLSAIFSIVSSNKHAQALKSVMNNLNFAVESMTRTIKTGSNYSTTGTCNDGTSKLTVGNAIEQSVPGYIVSYSLGDSASGAQNQIQKSVVPISGGQTPPPSLITAPEVKIDYLCFYVSGTGVDDLQPKVTIVVKGSTNIDQQKNTNFNIQTTVSQRLID